MVKKTQKSISLKQACEGVLLHKIAEGKSENTIRDYKNSLKKLESFFPQDTSLASITKSDLVRFFGYLQQEYTCDPDGVARRGEQKLSQKSILNIHTALSAMWRWALDEKLVDANVVREIKITKPSPPVIKPFTVDEWQRLLATLDFGRTWKTRATTKSHRPTADRDRAILYTLHDTGARASELCGLRFKDWNLTDHSLVLRGKGPGKEPKERIVYVGKTTSEAVWRYLLPRLEGINDDSPLFVVGSNGFDRPFNRNHLRKLLNRIGKKAGVQNVHPHRFRHTFAINYLRNGGNVFALQAMLGHTTLDMVRRYLQIANIDLDQIQKKTSPVDNWRK